MRLAYKSLLPKLTGAKKFARIKEKLWKLKLWGLYCIIILISFIFTDMDDTLDRKLQNKGIPDVENLRIDPVKPYVEPYVENMRQAENVQPPSYDCYYDTIDHVLSNHEKFNR